MSQLEGLKDQLAADNAYLKEEVKLNHNFKEMVGGSSGLREVLHKIEQVAETHATVLILGETGTGKEPVAHAVHDLSPRRDRPLVKVNCAALPSALVESEFFGHEKGAFTGALAKKMGRFALADGGTIFLDEIGDLPLELQAKLLRVLQEGEFDPVGSTKSVKVDVRVIAATNRNLQEAVSTGDFRSDLYYRLNVFPITIPPLRERKEDIPALVELFVAKFNRSMGKDVSVISQQVMDTLQAYEWPGNIRELQNVVERAVILSEGQALRLEGALEGVGAAGEVPTVGESLVDVERAHIQGVLEKCSWKVAGKKGAAARLGLNPSTLRSRIEKLGIRKPNGGS
jgi:transcriptional regulator with GAF, ATPase, and Fis domain